MPSREELDAYFKELTKQEVAFCEEMKYLKNEYGAYIYATWDGNSSINLPLTLQHYKQWLIENNIVKEFIQ